jgi:DNA-binding transcriptional regulator YiaG
MTHRPEPYTAEELRAWRAKTRFTQAQVAALFGVSQRAISSWEDGRIPRRFSEQFERVLIDWYNKEKMK